MSKGKVTVVLRSRNEERWVGHAIQSVVDKIENPEIILVDNNSDDSTRKIAQSFKADPDRENNGNYTDLKILSIDDYSPGRALNLGVSEAANEYILILSSHCVLTKFSLDDHRKDLENYVGLFGNQIPVWEGKKITKRYLWSHFGKKKVEKMYSQMEDRYFFHNALAFFKKSTLIDFPFDENLVGKEDRYWAIDRINEGHSTLYTPEMEALHHYTDNGNTWKGIG